MTYPIDQILDLFFSFFGGPAMWYAVWGTVLGLSLIGAVVRRLIWGME